MSFVVTQQTPENTKVFVFIQLSRIQGTLGLGLEYASDGSLYVGTRDCRHGNPRIQVFLFFMPRSFYAVDCGSAAAVVQ